MRYKKPTGLTINDILAVLYYCNDKLEYRLFNIDVVKSWCKDHLNDTVDCISIESKKYVVYSYDDDINADCKLDSFFELISQAIRLYDGEPPMNLISSISRMGYYFDFSGRI